MFIGREEQLSDLESLWRKRTSSLVACRGRRRIGKSTLFREFARRSADVYYEFEGLPPNPEKPVTNEDQGGFHSVGLLFGIFQHINERNLSLYYSMIFNECQ